MLSAHLPPPIQSETFTQDVYLKPLTLPFTLHLPLQLHSAHGPGLLSKAGLHVGMHLACVWLPNADLTSRSL